MCFRLVFGLSRVWPSGPAAFFCGDWSWNNVYGHSTPTADSSRTVVSYWLKDEHWPSWHDHSCWLGLSLHWVHRSFCWFFSRGGSFYSIFSDNHYCPSNKLNVYLVTFSEISSQVCSSVSWRRVKNWPSLWCRNCHTSYPFQRFVMIAFSVPEDCFIMYLEVLFLSRS